MSVFRSTIHIYAQIIDDTTGRTLVQASSLDKDVASVEPAAAGGVAAAARCAREGRCKERRQAWREKGGKQACQAEPRLSQARPAEASKKTRLAQQVGTLLAQRAQEKGIK